MPAPTLIRPKLSSDQWSGLEDYLVEHFRRVSEARSRQIDTLYDQWSQNYDAIPAEKVRKVPFLKASNFVVPTIRIFVDTAVARTQGAIWSTNPLISVDGFPNEAREGGETYLNRKARYEWGYYKLLNGKQLRGLKYGTAVTKLGWETRECNYVKSIEGGIQSEPAELYAGPWAKPIPFEDFFVYPIEADELEDVVVKYHRQRRPEEFARRMLSEQDEKIGRPRWKLTTQELESAMKMTAENKRQRQQAEAGVDQPSNYREFEYVESYLEWEIGGVYYPVVAFIQPDIGKLMDVYFDPIKATGAKTFVDYRPYQRDGLFYGDSMCRLLEQAQEEISRIHNERRDANMIANGPQFKRKSGSRLPNPAINGYPGKVWEVDEMDDFDVVNFGRAINDTIVEEQHCFSIAERLIGLDGIMQGASQGSSKRGIYSTGGTMAVMAQSNSRQMTHIRDFRWSVSEIAKSCFILQRTFGKEDPTIGMFDAPIQEKIQAFMEAATPDRLQRSFFEVKASDPSQNKEIDRQNLLQMAATTSQYAQQAIQLAQQYQMAQGKNPMMEQLLKKTLQMQHSTMVSLTRAFDQLQMEGKLPDAARYIEQLEQQQQQMADQQRIPAAGANGGGLGAGGGGGLQQIMAQLEQAGASLQ